MHDGNDACSLTYTWLSDGTPVSATLGEGNLPGRLYNGSFVFVTDSTRIDIAESVAWDEGRIFFLDTDTTDCWYAGDHLGNVRSVIDISRGQAVPQVLEQSDYLPYGTRINNLAFALMSGENRWRYAAKEEQRLNCLVTDPFAPDGEYNRSLGLLNFGARMYDPFTARWTAIDPIAINYQTLSPFLYCSGNSISFLDFHGTNISEFNEEGQYLRTIKDNFFHNLFFGRTGRIINSSGEVLRVFSFADPKHDVDNLKTGTYSSIVIVKDDDIEQMLDDAGAFSNTVELNNARYDYIRSEAMGKGKLDFSYSAIPIVYPEASSDPGHYDSPMLFLVGSIAHNHLNYGNFLYGAAGKVMGLTGIELLLGAHYNSVAHPIENGYDSQLDSIDDQRSIKAGIRYARSNYSSLSSFIVGKHVCPVKVPDGLYKV